MLQGDPHRFWMRNVHEAGHRGIERKRVYENARVVVDDPRCAKRHSPGHPFAGAKIAVLRNQVHGIRRDRLMRAERANVDELASRSSGIRIMRFDLPQDVRADRRGVLYIDQPATEEPNAVAAFSEPCRQHLEQ
jgi:hypothetical protein